MIIAKVVQDSIAPNGKRIVTQQLSYPRFIHSELMTHRLFSRNASSSRAIPVAKLIEQVRTEPAMPIHWGANEPGMQAHAELTGAARKNAMDEWRRAAMNAADTAEAMNALGLHKQAANRVLEPFLNIQVIVTATEWQNWYALRDHEDAQPEIRELARAMRVAANTSAPVERPHDRGNTEGWHLPYITRQERLQYPHHPAMLAKVSAARCARVSYLTHDGAEPDMKKDIALYDRLVGSVPLHASPVEHQAYPLALSTQASKNFLGWRQHREIVELSFQ